MKRKLVLVTIGSSCSGKTTLRTKLTDTDAGAEKHYEEHLCFFANRYQCCGSQFKKKTELLEHVAVALADGKKHEPERGLYAPYKVGWTTFANGTSVCGLNGKDGHPGTGADSNGNLDACNYAIDRCLEVSDFVIFDGVMSSQKLVAHLANHKYPNLAVIWVYLNVSPETVLARLAQRRTNNGEEETSEKTKQGVLNFRARAEKMWEYIGQNYQREPWSLVEIPEGPTPEEIHDALKPVIADMQKDEMVAGA
jgi:deoxyadenosine/deoxycytidine kinase